LAPYSLGMLELTFRPDLRRQQPVYRQLADYLHALVEQGRLSPGEKLPATRDLAEQLDLSRNTVSHAYERLVSEGFATAHVGRGTYVSVTATRPSPVADRERGFAWDALFAHRVGRLELPAGASAAARRDPIRFDFTGGRVDPELLPVSMLRKAWSRAVADHIGDLARPVEPMGWPELREAIARSLVARGVLCSASEVLVVSGAQQALDLLARVLIDPGDAVAIEQPGYFGASLAFRASGAQLLGVSVDEQGLDTNELARLLRSRRVKLVYTTPSAQCPTGAVLSEERRAMLHALSDRYQMPIVEDDYDSEFRYESPLLPALKTTDAAGRVIYVGTFSKALFPGLRVGYLVAPRPLLSRLALARFGADFGSDVLAQIALTDLIDSGVLERHVRRMRREHALRRTAMLDALAASMPEGASWTRPSAGQSICLTLPPGVDAEALERSARSAGIAYVGANAFYFRPGAGSDRIVLCFVHQPVEALREGVQLLAELVTRATDAAAVREVA
jgi:GntR family transcriptional regulator/MocR family aminotransferase